MFIYNILSSCSGYDAQIYTKELPKKYGEVDFIANVGDIHINHSISSDYDYEFDANGKPLEILLNILLLIHLNVWYCH